MKCTYKFCNKEFTPKCNGQKFCCASCSNRDKKFNKRNFDTKDSD